MRQPFYMNLWNYLLGKLGAIMRIFNYSEYDIKILR